MPPPKKKIDPETEFEQILAEVREMLTIADDAGDVNELLVLQMLLQVTKELHNTTVLHDLITKVLDSAIAFVGGTRAFMILLEDGELHFKMGRDVNGAYLSREDFSISQSVVEHVLETQKTLVVPDAQLDEVLSKRRSVVDMSLRTIMCSPLMIKRVTIGLLYVDSTSDPVPKFSNKSYVNFLASLADQSAVAIRNAQKFETHSE